MAKRIKKLQTPDLTGKLTPLLLGQAIKARRTQSNLRLEDAAALCGVAKQTLMNIEHGHANCKFESVIQICDAFGIQLSILPWHNDDEGGNDWQ